MLSGLKYFEMAIKKKPGADSLQEKVDYKSNLVWDTVSCSLLAEYIF